jgi:predicted glutamine amidotransferase
VERPQPARPRSRDLIALFFAHIRASTGTAIQETNTHPFRFGSRLWMHNGLVRDFHLVKRELQNAVDDAYFD